MLQPGQVLVRQIIPGVPQPVFRAVTIQPGQVIQGQPGQHLQTIQRPNLPGGPRKKTYFQYKKISC